MARAEQLRPGVNLPEFKAPHKHTLNKIIAGALAIPVIAAGIKFGVDDYFNSNNDHNIIVPPTRPTVEDTLNPTSTRSPENTPAVSPTKTPEVTPTPSPEKVLSQAEKNLKLAPDIEGLTKVVQTIDGLERATYVDKEGNYAGEYYKNVEFQGKEIGGVVLTPNRVEKMVREKLANGIPWIIFVTADLSDIKNTETKVTVQIIDTDPKYNFPQSGLKVSFGGEKVSISNPNIDSATSGINNTVKSLLFPGMSNGISSNVVYTDSFEQKNLGVKGTLDFPEQVIKKSTPFDDTKMAETSNPICMAVSSKIAVATIDKSKILLVDNCIVFVKSN